MILQKIIESLAALTFGLLALYAVICLYAFLFADVFVFASAPPTYDLNTQNTKDSKDIVVVTSRLGDQIPLLYLPNPAARYTILYSHGNMEDIGFLRPRMETFRKHGFSVLAYDYPGFGRATGAKSEDGCFAAADAAYKYLTQTLHVSPSQILLYGRSMGGGPTANLAAKHLVGGVILQSTFVSAFRVQTGIKILPWDCFNNLAAIPHIRSPIFFVHGLSDETIPAWHTQELLLSARAPTVVLTVPYALHNNVIEIAADSYWETFAHFITLVDKLNADHAASLSPTISGTPPPPIPFSTPGGNNIKNDLPSTLPISTSPTNSKSPTPSNPVLPPVSPAPEVPPAKP
jgi:pimeloyl-ACP methyl ester carboxylesterase